MLIPKVSLDQWLTFKMVVDQGSYALAAAALHKSQSAVSYAINRLNEQLPQPVLSLVGRKALLTDAGETLYRYAEQIIKQANDAEAVASSLAMGYEAEVTLAVDVLVEIDAVMCSFEEFSREFPHTRIRVLETSLSGTTEALLEKQADIVIGSIVPVGFSGKPLMQAEMVPVAAPDHPLIKNRQDVGEMELRNHRQVVLRDTGMRREQDAGWLQSEQRWTVSHFSTSVKLLQSGLVFGFIPKRWIAAELATGKLRRIPLKENLSRVIPIYLMLAEKEAAGPATRALAGIIANNNAVVEQ